MHSNPDEKDMQRLHFSRCRVRLFQCVQDLKTLHLEKHTSSTGPGAQRDVNRFIQMSCIGKNDDFLSFLCCHTTSPGDLPSDFIASELTHLKNDSCSSTQLLSPPKVSKIAGNHFLQRVRARALRSAASSRVGGGHDCFGRPWCTRALF